MRAHGATASSDAAYATKLAAFYGLQCRQAGAYAVYAAVTTFLPSAVVAVVLFYGGSLVLARRMSAGSLVSFMLYQQSLSGAFAMMGDVFSALTAAVGAADKARARAWKAAPPAGRQALHATAAAAGGAARPACPRRRAAATAPHPHRSSSS